MRMPTFRGMSPAAPPGWYPVPGDPSRVAYWDGSTWTAVQEASGPAGPPRSGTVGPEFGPVAPRSSARARHLAWSIPLAILVCIVGLVLLDSGPGPQDVTDWSVGARVRGPTDEIPAEGEDVVLADCDGAHAGRIVEIVSDAGDCPARATWFVEIYDRPTGAPTGTYYCIAP